MAPPPACGHPLGDLLMRLWENHEESQSLDLVLRDGAKISADYFSASLSGPMFGVFAKEDTGIHVLEILAWDDIARFSIRDDGIGMYVTPAHPSFWTRSRIHVAVVSHGYPVFGQDAGL